MSRTKTRDAMKTMVRIMRVSSRFSNSETRSKIKEPSSAAANGKTQSAVAGDVYKVAVSGGMASVDEPLSRN